MSKKGRKLSISQRNYTKNLAQKIKSEESLIQLDVTIIISHFGGTKNIFIDCIIYLPKLCILRFPGWQEIATDPSIISQNIQIENIGRQIIQVDRQIIHIGRQIIRDSNTDPSIISQNIQIDNIGRQIIYVDRQIIDGRYINII